MGFFPQLSNVYPELQTLLETRSRNTNKPWTEGGVSGLSTWLRVVSTVDKGLVMVRDLYGIGKGDWQVYS